MRHKTVHVRRALVALIGTVLALGALGAPAAASSDGIALVAVQLPDDNCGLEVRKDGTTVKTIRSPQPEWGGQACGELGDAVRLAGDELVYFQWGFVYHQTFCASGRGCWEERIYDSDTWVTDGTEAGTIERPDICSYDWLVSPSFIYAECRRKWSWVRDGEAGLLSRQPYPYGSEVLLGDRLVYSAKDSRGVEPWAVTGGGTPRLLRDIRIGPKGSDPKDFRVRWGKLYFTANDGTRVARWVTDGTRVGTHRVVRP